MVENLPQLESRLNTLEGQNRRLRLACCLFAISMTAVLGVGFRRQQTTSASIPGSAEIQAQRFVLVDSGGRERAVLGLGPEGPFLHFLASPSGTVPASTVPASMDASGVVVRGPSGVSATLQATGLELGSMAGHAELNAQSLKIQHSASSASVNMQIVREGPTLLLQDASGGLASMGVHSYVPAGAVTPHHTSAASIALVSPDHHILWSAPPARR